MKTARRISSLADAPVGDEARPAPDAMIMELAARQHGVVSRAQLLKAGIAAHRIEYRVKIRRLRQIHFGVYRVGPVAAPREREIAAVLACGETAVVSHRSAAALWELIPAQDATTPVDVSILGSRSERAGVRVHRVNFLAPNELTRLDDIPITTPARALLELAGCSGGRELERALGRADRRGLVDQESMKDLLARHVGRRGSRQLRSLLHAGSPRLTRSEAEARFLDLIRRARLRMPETNVVVQGYERDCLWRKERLVVEIDGLAFHSSASAFESDRRRDAVLTAAGFRVIRTTWRQLTGEPEALLVRVAQALSGAAPGRGAP